MTGPSSPGTNNVTVGWTASTDNVAVTSYDVYRDTTAGFTPGAGNKVGSSPSSSYSDTNVPLGTYYYKVIANDAVPQPELRLRRRDGHRR